MPAITASDADYIEYAATPASYQIAASNHPTLYGARGLPGGLTLDSRTGLITGHCTDRFFFSQAYQVTLLAGNAAGTTAATITLTVIFSMARPPIDDSDSSQPSDCGLGGGVALITLFGLTALGRGTRKSVPHAARR